MRKVSVETSGTDSILNGEEIVLTAHLENFDDCSEVIVIWQVDQGEGWTEAGRGEQYTYTADDESIGWKYRALASYRK